MAGRATKPIETLRAGLQAVELTRRAGSMTVKRLAGVAGWTPSKACRYLTELDRLGWLEQVGEKRAPVYVLGRKVLELSPDLRL